MVEEQVDEQNDRDRDAVDALLDGLHAPVTANQIGPWSLNNPHCLITESQCRVPHAVTDTRSTIPFSPSALSE